MDSFIVFGKRAKFVAITWRKSVQLKLHNVLLFLFMIALPCSSSGRDLTDSINNNSNQDTPDKAASIPHLPNIQDSREYMVVDPISNGEVYIYEAGMNHQASIILIHGVGDEASQIWGQLIPELVKQYHVVTFDLPGFGLSSKQNILYSPEFYSEFIRWVKDSYVKERPMYIIGHSLGGAVALCYAAIYPDNLQQLILVDVSGVIHRLALTQYIMKSNPERHSGLMKIPSKLFGGLMSNTIGAMESHGLSDRLDKILDSPTSRRKFLKADPKKIAGLALANFDFSNLIYQVKAPAVIIWGSDDPTTPLRTGKLLTYTLKQTQLQIIPDTGHNPILERPEYFNSLVKDALVLESWESSWKQPEKTHRVAILSQKHDLRLTGHYKYIELSHCGGIRMENLETEYMKILNCDDVVLENCRIYGNDFALNTRGSRITLTGVHLSGETAIIVSGCILDLAGVKLTGKEAAVRAINGSNLLFSVSKIESPYNKGYIHGFYEVVRDRPL